MHKAIEALKKGKGGGAIKPLIVPKQQDTYPQEKKSARVSTEGIEWQTAE